MFSTLRRLFVLAAGTLTAGLLFAPLAFAVNAGDGAAGGPNPTTPTHHAATGSALATWQWTLISVGIAAAVAAVLALAITASRRTKHTTALHPQTP